MPYLNHFLGHSLTFTQTLLSLAEFYVLLQLLLLHLECLALPFSFYLLKHIGFKFTASFQQQEYKKEGVKRRRRSAATAAVVVSSLTVVIKLAHPLTHLLTLELKADEKNRLKTGG